MSSWDIEQVIVDGTEWGGEKSEWYAKAVDSTYIIQGKLLLDKAAVVAGLVNPTRPMSQFSI